MTFTNRRLMVLAALIAVFAALSGVGAWIVARYGLGLEGDQLTLWVSIVSGAGAIIGGVIGQPLFGAALAQRLEIAQPSVPTPETLDRWCTLLRIAVQQRRLRGTRSQREQMLRGNVLIDQVISPQVTISSRDAGRPRVRIEGPPESWSLLLDHWSSVEGRLVILGDPGYGKTFAALAVIAHVNQTARQVAELFPLVEWYAWAAGRADQSIEEWLPHQLTQTYPQLPLSAARAIVAQDQLIPVFDGLDEVPEAARTDCRDALEAYAGRTAPHRPFVVTSRQREYLALAPKWVGADRHVAIAGLSPTRVLEVLRESVGALPQWEPVLAAVEDGDPQLLALLRSPLRLGSAIEAYGYRDPRELLALAARPDAEEHLWDLLLLSTRRSYSEARPEDVRRWLSFIAASLRRHDRQRLWLHELHLCARPRDQRLFYLPICAVGVLQQIGMDLLVGTLYSWIWTAGVLIILILVYRPLSDHPPVQTVSGHVTWRQYVRALPHSFRIAVVVMLSVALIALPFVFTTVTLAPLLGGEAIGLDLQLLRTLKVTISLATFSAMAVTIGFLADVGTLSVSQEPPAHLAGRGPGAVLAGTRNHGIVVTALTVVVLGFPIAWFFADLGPAVWLVLAWAGAVNGFVNGLGTWLYFHWTRWRLARAGLLPRHLTAFLEWGVKDVGWLRVSDAYEFRHKGLLDHLARDAES